MTRRRLLTGSLSVVMLQARASNRSIYLGAPVRESPSDPRELARAHRALGYSAAFCPRVKPDDRALTRAIEEAFAAERVILAEVGAFKNMLDGDPEKRKQNMRFVTDGLALAEAVGALCCVDYAGSYSPKSSYGPDPKNLSQEFFDATVENCRKVIDEIKPKRTKFTIEMMGWSVPDGPDSYLRLIKAVDRASFGVHMDICNVINSPRRFYDNAGFIEECFRKLGRWIVSCHAKDLEWILEMNLHFREVVPGRGGIDYRAYVREIARLPRVVPLMLEHLSTTAEYQEGRRYIEKVAGEVGLSLA